MAQRSNKVFDTMLESLYSSEYAWSHQAWIARDGECHSTKRRCSLPGKCRGFVDEHKRHANRWNLKSIDNDFTNDENIAFHLVGSEEEQFEHQQIDLASERLGKYYPHVTKIERIPGEHWATLEQGGTLAKMIEMLTNQPHANDDWTGHSISIVRRAQNNAMRGRVQSSKKCMNNYMIILMYFCERNLTSSSRVSFITVSEICIQRTRLAFVVVHRTQPILDWSPHRGSCFGIPE